MSYVLLGCVECGHKQVCIKRTSDGKMCPKCGSAFFVPVACGKKKELVKHISEKE